jgi:hypothetical protein
VFLLEKKANAALTAIHSPTTVKNLRLNSKNSGKAKCGRLVKQSEVSGLKTKENKYSLKQPFTGGISMPPFLLRQLNLKMIPL